MEVMAPEGHVETSHQSGIGRFFNSIIAAVCVSPLILLLVVCIVGYNEKRDVCESRALDAGLEKTATGACNSYDDTDGKLIIFTCKASKCDCEDGEVDLSKLELGPFKDKLKKDKLNVGLKIKVEMKQCIEVTESSSTKDKGGGGGKTTQTKFTYKVGWSATHYDSSKFNVEAMKNAASGFTTNCNPDSEAFQNPAFPIEGDPAYAKSVKLEAYTVKDPQYIRSIPLTEKAIKDKPNDDWEKDCDGFHFCTKDTYKPNGKKLPKSGIGKLRVSFYTFDTDKPKMTVLGENKKGVVGKWTAPASWMCKDYEVGSLRSGEVSKEDFFKDLKATSGAITWLLRIGGFLLAWLAFSMMLAPLGVVADCIPCVGPCLGDMMEAIACVVAICPACACTILVAGIVWIFMRPLFGLACMAVSIIIFGAMLYLRTQKSARAVDPLMGGVVRY